MKKMFLFQRFLSAVGAYSISILLLHYLDFLPSSSIGDLAIMGVVISFLYVLFEVVTVEPLLLKSNFKKSS
ncbi:hypothetical protein [Endozoicomonas sp. 4G]|uniref:hypothetical protein n=1 Tax=Endozoicomonas sp. 4G TaxID=2872754 RepID=UPI0020788353|nr:hypothetical protein [Endozoicomonas sp. 4G]